MKSFLLIATTLLSGVNSIAQTYSRKDFEEVALPKVESPEWYELNNATNKDIAVSIAANKIHFGKAMFNSKVIYPLAEGELLGINLGEFGGGLYYRPNDSTKKSLSVNGSKSAVLNDPFRGGLFIPKRNPVTKLIEGSILLKNGNVKFIFSFNDSLYSIEGLAHMSLSYGAMYRLKKEQDDSFAISSVLAFEDAPMAISVQKSTVLVATNEQFCTVDRQLNKTLVVDKAFWNSLYPNSIAVLNKHSVYIGMRGGYAKLDLTNKSLRFFKLKG